MKNLVLSIPCTFLQTRQIKPETSGNYVLAFSSPIDTSRVPKAKGFKRQHGLTDRHQIPPSEDRPPCMRCCLILTTMISETISDPETRHLLGNAGPHMKPDVFWNHTILSRHLKIDTLGITKICANVAIAADIGRVGRKYDAELTTGYISAGGIVMGKRDMSEAFKQDNPSAQD